MTALPGTILGASRRIVRNYIPNLVFTPTALLATTPTLDLCGIAFGNLWVPASGPTSLEVYCSPDPTGVSQAFQRLRYNGSDVTWAITAQRSEATPDWFPHTSYTRFVVAAGSSAVCYLYIAG
jgi:hypothetical protein